MDNLIEEVEAISSLDPGMVRLAFRQICRYMGGQQVYIPKGATSNSSIDYITVIIVDALGNEAGGTLVQEIKMQLGGNQIYIPKELNTFRQEITDEITGKYRGNSSSIHTLCREYQLSFATIYRLCREGLKRA